MIAIVQGTLFEQGQDHIIVETGGIGYRIQVPLRTLAALGAVGSTIRLRTHLEVREDSWTLFGFTAAEEVEMFHLLTSVSGVGPKMGLAILSAHTVPQIARGILDEDTKMFTAISGVGKKTAGRLLLELKDKVGAYSLAFTALPGEAPAAALGAPKGAEDEVRMALEALGMKGAGINDAVRAAVKDLGPQAPVADLLKQALNHFRR